MAHSPRWKAITPPIVSHSPECPHPNGRTDAAGRRKFLQPKKKRTERTDGRTPYNKGASVRSPVHRPCSKSSLFPFFVPGHASKTQIGSNERGAGLVGRGPARVHSPFRHSQSAPSQDSWIYGSVVKRNCFVDLTELIATAAVEAMRKGDMKAGDYCENSKVTRNTSRMMAPKRASRLHPASPVTSEPIREVLESAESDVIHCWALDSVWGSARCGSPNTA
jgi:hypothetical protein